MSTSYVPSATKAAQLRLNRVTDSYFRVVLDNQERIKTLLERGLQEPGDTQNRLGFHVGQLGLEGER